MMWIPHLRHSNSVRIKRKHFVNYKNTLFSDDNTTYILFCIDPLFHRQQSRSQEVGVMSIKNVFVYKN